jgi:hypothetical protein
LPNNAFSCGSDAARPAFRAFRTASTMLSPSFCACAPYSARSSIRRSRSFPWPVTTAVTSWSAERGVPGGREPRIQLTGLLLHQPEIAVCCGHDRSTASNIPSPYSRSRRDDGTCPGSTLLRPTDKSSAPEKT